MNPKAKLYLVVREDLPLAQQAVQACHALQEFNMDHREAAYDWFGGSNHLALLSAPNEAGLEHLARVARRRGFLVSAFREPDRANELTAIALEPKAKGLLRKLPLAFSGVRK